MAMAAVSTESARIGDGDDMLRRGIISRANPLAAACGVVAGQSVSIAVDLLKAAPWPHARPAALAEGRVLVGKIVCLDSMSLGDGRAIAGRVVASGSHGGVLAGETAAAFARRSSCSTMQASAPTAPARQACRSSTRPASPP